VGVVVAMQTASRSFLRWSVLVCCLILGSCIRAPAPDALANGPTVDEIVQRVKCDLYEGVAEPLNAPYGYEWLQYWTAQSSLNLIVNDQSQVAPGATLTNPLRAKTIPLVTTNFSQSFNLGLGAQWSNTATRNETITFTVSLDELRSELKNRPQNCLLPDIVDLRSDLGVREWIAASLSPVANGYLNSGYHKAPKTGGAGAQSAKAAMAEVLGPAAHIVNPVQPPCLPPPHFTGTRRNVDNEIVFCDLAVLQRYQLSQLDGPQVKFVAKAVRDLQNLIRDQRALLSSEQLNEINCNKLPSPPMNETEKIIVNVCALEKTAVALAVFLDPPIDTISYQVQFIIVWGGAVNPGWSLLRFKGPNPASGSMLSASKTSTHSLNIVMGPPSSQDLQNATSAFLIGTAVSNGINNSPTVLH
jgi:hypothetical protein